MTFALVFVHGILICTLSFFLISCLGGRDIDLNATEINRSSVKYFSYYIFISHI